MLHGGVAKGLYTVAELSCSVNVNITIEYQTLLLMQHIPTNHGKALSFFDNGSTISLVSKSYTIRNKMKGMRVSFDLITVGGNVVTHFSYSTIFSS